MALAFEQALKFLPDFLAAAFDAGRGFGFTGGGIDSYALTLPVILETGKGLSEQVQKAQKEKGQSFVDQMIPKMRQALYADLGVRFPGVHVRTESPTLEKDEYSIHLNEVPIVRGKVMEGHLLTNESEENLGRYNLPFVSYRNSLGLPSFYTSYQLSATPASVAVVLGSLASAHAVNEAVAKTEE